MSKVSFECTNFRNNIATSFSLLRTEDLFGDVTLIGDDQKQFTAHKVVLSACSTFFRNILRNSRGQQANILVCLNDVKSDDINHILDYIYHGQVKVMPTEIDRFLKVANRFELDGLKEYRQEDIPKPTETLESIKCDLDDIESDTEIATSSESESSISENDEINGSTTKTNIRRNMKIEFPEFETMEELEAIVNEKILEVDGTFYCKICSSYSSKRSHHLKDHVQTHIANLVFPCESCDKTFASVGGFRRHKRTKHQ